MGLPNKTGLQFRTQCPRCTRWFNSPSRSSRLRALRAVSGCAAGAFLLAGCVNPLSPLDSDYGPRVPAERLRSVGRFDPAPYQRPPRPAPTTYAEAGERLKSRFEGLKEVSLTLEEVRAQTLESNLDLEVALIDPTISRETVRAEEAKFEAVFRPFGRAFVSDRPAFNVTDTNQQEGQAVGAAVDIPLRTGGRASVELAESRSETDNPFVPFTTSYDSALTFSISQPLLRNAGRRANTYSIRVASVNDSITQARTKLEVIRVLASADRAYWRLYAARNDLEITQREYELALAQLERARSLVRAGDVPEIEITRAESGLASTLERIITAENNLLVLQRELKRILNSPDLALSGSTILLTETPPDPVAYDFDSSVLIPQALANRMEMLELELQLALDLSTIEFQKNQALPSFVLDYQYSINGLGSTFSESNDQLSDNEFESWSLNVSGEIPLGNQAARARVQRAILTRLQRLSTRDARALAIEQEVLNSIDAVELGWQRIMAARQSVIAAARTYEAEQRQFEAGLRTSTEVLESANRLANAQRTEVRAITDYQISLIDLSFATGTLLGAAKLDFEPSDPRDHYPPQVVDPVAPPFPALLDPRPGFDESIPDPAAPQRPESSPAPARSDVPIPQAPDPSPVGPEAPDEPITQPPSP